MSARGIGLMHVQPDVSVLIVSWNTRDLLVLCIESVFSSTRAVSLEVIVVDNASSDGSPEAVRQRFPEVNLLPNPDNRGFAAANNQGIHVARGRYVLLLNSDTILLERCLDKMVAFADAQPRAGAVGCRVLNPDRTVQPSCMTFPCLLNLAVLSMCLHRVLPRSRLFGRPQMTWWTYDEIREVEYIKGCFLLVRREAVKEVGLLDERFYMFGEEADWCCRMRKASWRVVFSPCGEIIHYGSASTCQVEHNMVLQQWGSMLGFVRKHHRYSYYIACSVLVGVFFGLRAVGCAVLSLLLPRRRAWLLDLAKAYQDGLRRLILRGPEGLCVQTS